ncbi:lysophosphatidic acid:oleoyl-CoA acyltransferase vps66 [Acrasis kona]|uniref:Lysophosphatidic acid:oleoyl-CoA acyltransferase vps66 n=1 Tax=Acrasis kona TaxID=1008807 RepID=A0AAW2YIP0_9EUKA
MEKYKKWTDASTGINPFVPYKKKLNKSVPALEKFLIAPIRLILISPILFLIKLILISIVLTTISLLSFVVGFIPLSFIRRPLDRYIQLLGSRTVLALLGFYNISTATVNSKGRTQESSFGDVLQSFPSGDLIVSNHMSYTDILYYSFRHAPTFATVVKGEGRSKYMVVRQTFIGALLRTMFQTDLSGYKKERLLDVIKHAKDNKLGPVVLFPEATTSNGFSTLKYQSNLFDGLDKDEKLTLFVCAIKYEYSNFNPAFHLENFWSHFYHLCSQIQNTMSVRTVKFTADENKELKSSISVADQLRTFISTAQRTKLVASSIEDKESFLKYWAETQIQGYTEK